MNSKANFFGNGIWTADSQPVLHAIIEYGFFCA